MKTSESAEMYLEAIILLQERSPHVRSIDVAHHTGYSKPSVSRAMGLLRAAGNIEIDENGYIALTAQGKDLAERILERHRTLKAFLIDLGVSAETADSDACKMEHILSDEVFERMRDHLNESQK